MDKQPTYYQLEQLWHLLLEWPEDLPLKKSEVVALLADIPPQPSPDERSGLGIGVERQPYRPVSAEETTRLQMILNRIRQPSVRFTT